MLDKLWMKLKGLDEEDQSEWFNSAVEEALNKYDKNEICVKKASKLRGHIKGCKVLIIKGDASAVNANWLFDKDSVEMIIIQEGPTGIKESSFNYLKKLKTLYLPNTLKNIEQSAFNGCYSLKELNFQEGSGELTISQGAFERCSSLENISINRDGCYVGCAAFWDCDNLKSIAIKGEMSSTINAFNFCRKLEHIEMDNLKEWMEDRRAAKTFEPYVYWAYDRAKQKSDNKELGTSFELEPEAYEAYEDSNSNVICVKEIKFSNMEEFKKALEEFDHLEEVEPNEIVEEVEEAEEIEEVEQKEEEPDYAFEDEREQRKENEKEIVR